MWWNNDLQTKVHVIMPAKHQEENGRDEIVRRMRHLTLQKLGFLDPQGKFLEKAKRELLIPHEDGDGERTFIAQSPIFSDMFLIYSIREIKDKTNKVRSFAVKEFLKHASDPESFRQSLKPYPHKA